MTHAEKDNAAPGFAKHPGYRLELKPCAKRVRVKFGGETIIDTTRSILMLESTYIPVYYFPWQDFKSEFADKTAHSSHCPFKGEASYWTLKVGGKTAENAVWGYEAPYDEAHQLAGMVALYWQPMDGWYEEDEEVFGHARDPNVRLDILNSSRPVRVEIGGMVIAESKRTRFLFETGLAPRHYIPREDVRMDLLTESERRTRCPYKGEAQYFSLSSGGETIDDIAWSYAQPLPEATPITDYICFHKRQADGIYVDGVRQENMQSE